jgi:hypothetical protein
VLIAAAVHATDLGLQSLSIATNPLVESQEKNMADREIVLTATAVKVVASHQVLSISTDMFQVKTQVLLPSP